MKKQNTRPVIAMNLDVFDDLAQNEPQNKIGMFYVDAVIAAGGLPLLIPSTGDLNLLRWYVDRADGVLLIGGPDYPAAWFRQKKHPLLRPVHSRRAAGDRVLARLVLATRLPLLGICGGHQLIAIMKGGALIQHIATADRHGKGQKHPIRLTAGRILKELFPAGRLTVNSYHHQAIDPEALGRGLQVAAIAGDGVIEAVESLDARFVLGVQWHPEHMAGTGHCRRIFGAFLDAARTFRRKRGAKQGR